MLYRRHEILYGTETKEPKMRLFKNMMKGDEVTNYCNAHWETVNSHGI
jgi:hypothetical protein